MIEDIQFDNSDESYQQALFDLHQGASLDGRHRLLVFSSVLVERGQVEELERAVYGKHFCQGALIIPGTLLRDRIL